MQPLMTTRSRLMDCDDDVEGENDEDEWSGSVRFWFAHHAKAGRARDVWRVW